MHGMLDNAASFDYLIPLLPENYYYVCIDLPGHGRSSTPQWQLPLHLLDFCIVLKMVLDYIERKDCYAIGHSLGGIIVIRTAQLFPSYFRKIVLIDGAFTIPIEVGDYSDYMIRHFNGIIKCERDAVENREQPTYTYEEALKRVSVNRYYQPLAREKAKPLLNRMIEPVGDGKYRFTVDPKCKHILNTIHGSDYSVNLVKIYPITCPMLVVVDSAHNFFLNYFSPVLKEYEKQRNINVKYIKATHDMHITIPHVIAPLISDLFNKTLDNKL